MDFASLSKKDENYNIRIDDNGDWWHEDALIKRKELVKLFRTVLRYDQDKDEYWLITPAEAGRIKVDDVPFVIKDYKWSEDNLFLISNLDEKIEVSDENNIELLFSKKHQMKLPYVMMGNGLKARFSRNVYYHLLNESAQEDGCFYIMVKSKKIVIGQIDA